MRLLNDDELILISGGEGDDVPPEDDTETYGKNNNGYGNGAESGPPPGRSGLHNPQLTEWNRGPRGAR